MATRHLHDGGQHVLHDASALHHHCPSAAGSSPRLTLDVIRTVFHLPSTEAATALGIAHSRLKRFCRANRVARWPQRKLASLTLLRQTLSDDPKIPGEDREELLRQVDAEYEAVLGDPNRKLDAKLDQLRLYLWKARHYLKRKAEATNVRQADHAMPRGGSSEDEDEPYEFEDGPSPRQAPPVTRGSLWRCAAAGGSGGDDDWASADDEGEHHASARPCDKQVGATAARPLPVAPAAAGAVAMEPHSPSSREQTSLCPSSTPPLLVPGGSPAVPATRRPSPEPSDGKSGAMRHSGPCSGDGSPRANRTSNGGVRDGANNGHREGKTHPAAAAAAAAVNEECNAALGVLAEAASVLGSLRHGRFEEGSDGDDGNEGAAAKDLAGSHSLPSLPSSDQRGSGEAMAGGVKRKASFREPDTAGKWPRKSVSGSRGDGSEPERDVTAGTAVAIASSARREGAPAASQRAPPRKGDSSVGLGQLLQRHLRKQEVAGESLLAREAPTTAVAQPQHAKLAAKQQMQIRQLMRGQQRVEPGSNAANNDTLAQLLLSLGPNGMNLVGAQPQPQPQQLMPSWQSHSAPAMGSACGSRMPDGPLLMTPAMSPAGQQQQQQQHMMTFDGHSTAGTMGMAAQLAGSMHTNRGTNSSMPPVLVAMPGGGVQLFVPGNNVAYSMGHRPQAQHASMQQQQQGCMGMLPHSAQQQQQQQNLFAVMQLLVQQQQQQQQQGGAQMQHPGMLPPCAPLSAPSWHMPTGPTMAGFLRS